MTKSMKNWICRTCGQEVGAVEKPEPIHWSDGHACRFVECEEKEDDLPRHENDEQEEPKFYS